MSLFCWWGCKKSREFRNKHSNDLGVKKEVVFSISGRKLEGVLKNKP